MTCSAGAAVVCNIVSGAFLPFTIHACSLDCYAMAVPCTSPFAGDLRKVSVSLSIVMSLSHVLCTCSTQSADGRVWLPPFVLSWNA